MAVAFFWPLSAPAKTWQTEAIDTSDADRVYSSLTTDESNQVHLCYL